MTLRFAIVTVILATALAVGCGKSDQPVQVPAASASAPNTGMAPAANSGMPASGSDADLIRQAVEDHVRNDTSINMSAMDMTVDAVNVNGDQAQANATFRVKQGGATMAMVYSLERHGNGWLVVKGQPADGQLMHPPMDKTHSGMPPSPSAPAMPDVHDFLKNHPSTSSN